MPRPTRRPLMALFLVLGLAACAPSPKVDMAPKNLGDFRLGYDIVIAKNVKQVPPSRKATPEEWKTAIRSEIERRFRKYQGDRLYHIGINVDGYSLAVPGIPVLLAPKSVLVFTVNVWDDAKQAKLNKKPKQITVFEAFSPGTIIGSGWTETRKQQMENLAHRAGRAIESWLVQQRPTWFTHPDTAASPLADQPAVASAPPVVPPAVPSVVPPAVPPPAPRPSN